MKTSTGILALLGSAAIAAGAYVAHRKGKLKYLESKGKEYYYRGKAKCHKYCNKMKRGISK